MSTAMSMVKEGGHENAHAAGFEGPCDRPWFENVRWTTKQVVIACLWSILFGVGCGYAWVLLQVGISGPQ